MGQAKQRGSFEDRKSKAINNYSINRQIEQEIGLAWKRIMDSELTPEERQKKSYDDVLFTSIIIPFMTATERYKIKKNWIK